MDASNLFARMPETPEPIIAQVCRDLTRSGVADGRGDEIDLVAAAAVRELWDCRVKTFVPVLALREAREVLRQRGIVAEPPAEVPAVVAAHVRGADRDLLHVDADVPRVDHDVQRCND